MLLEVFQEHNSEYRELMNKEYAEGTVLRYERTARYLKEFISEQYKLADIPLKSINYEFITKFEHFIKIQKNCAQNATVKYLKNLKKIIKTALIKKWITDDPFAEIHFKQTKCNREFLNEMELRKIINKDFDIQRLQTVRDIFIFCCFTGIAYSDICRLRKDQIISDSDKGMYIHLYRTKTNHPAFIPLLPQARKMVSLYIGKGESEYLFPTISNQKSNAYLKELTDICHIRKRVTFHCFRHTFATTVTLANDVALQNVSKMLGHSSTRMTQHYARVLDNSIMKDMQDVARVFG